MNQSYHSRKNNLFIMLAAVFVTNALVAEIIGVKIFSLENSLGVAPAQIHLFNGFVLDFNLTAGAIIWPFVFIVTDIINEYFGKEKLKQISYITASLIGYSFLIIYISTVLAPSPFWIDINKTSIGTDDFNINSAFLVIFRQGIGIMLGSIVAFLVGQVVDTIVFHKIKQRTQHKRVWLRSTGSTLVSQFIDSFIVIFIAFYLFAPEAQRWSISQVLSIGIINYIYKGFVAVLLIPFIYFCHYCIDEYLGKEEKDLGNTL
ncbi:MAG: queuosine precursor transporter [Chitinophagaceae bacterium]|nr:queuosine precursor transporter [Chitinophagaceae bacterium]